MTPIVTGAAILRSKKVLTAAEIHGLDTAPVVIVPAIPVKSLFVTGVFVKYTFGTSVYAPTGQASLFYGPLSSNPTPLGGTNVLTVIDGIAASSVAAIAGLGGLSPLPSLLSAVQGLGLFLVLESGSANTGAATAATVDPANKGLLYAPGDTGTIDTFDPASYTVTGVGAGGLVTTVSVSGGNGFAVGSTHTTTVLTGSGDGTLQLTITAITAKGDGSVELDVSYQAI